MQKAVVATLVTLSALIPLAGCMSETPKGSFKAFSLASPTETPSKSPTTTPGGSTTPPPTSTPGPSNTPPPTSTPPPTPGPVPSGNPVFVAYGFGGVTATSCDRGRNWTLRQYTTDRADHGPWSAFGGLAFGNGVFVAATGWGSTQGSHALQSGSNFTWPSNTDNLINEMGIGGIVFNGTDFLSFTGLYTNIYYSSNGLSWQRRSDMQYPAAAQQFRQIRAYSEANLIVIAAENQNSNTRAIGNFMMTSKDNGRTWRIGTGFDPNCSSQIHYNGDIEYRAGNLIVGGKSYAMICRSTDEGLTWQTINAPFGASVTPSDFWADNEAFYAVTSNGIYRSVDGSAGSWTRTSAGASSAERGTGGGGTAVIVTDNNRFYWSDDRAANWTQGNVANNPSNATISGVEFNDFAVGYTNSACGN